MTALPGDCVIDACVAVKIVLPEELAEQARALVAGIADGTVDKMHVPDLFDVECASAIAWHWRRWGRPAHEAVEASNALREAAFTRWPTSALLANAVPLVINTGVSLYDACYVALADALGVPLVTADQRLVRAFAGSEHQVVALADFAV